MPPYVVENGDVRGRRQWIAALVLVAGALILRGLSPGVQQEIAASVRGTLLRPFIALQEGLVRGRTRGVQVEVLQAELDSLMAVVARQRTMAEENRRLQGLLELQERGGPVFRAITVLRPGTAGSASMFMVDAGSSDGVEVGAPVVTREGLVGVIRESGRGSSLGMDWTHPDFAAGAMTEDGELFGIVEARAGRFREEDRLLLSGTAFHERIDPGTLIVTSGAGGVYPRGIPLGTVVEEAEAEGGWRRSYWLQAAVSPAGVTHAQVLVDRQQPEIETFWQDSLGADTLMERERPGIPDLRTGPDTTSGDWLLDPGDPDPSGTAWPPTPGAMGSSGG